MAIDPILARHERILAAVEHIEALVAARPAKIDALAERRWAFTHEMLLHCARMSDLLAELMTDNRAEAMARAELANERTKAFVAYFHEHVARWYGFPAAEHWIEYRGAVERLAERIRELLECEAREIVPLLPVRPSGATAPNMHQDYVEDAVRVRRKIFDPNRRPLE